MAFNKYLNFETEVLILGIGNVLYGDEGFGIRAIENFYENYEHHPLTYPMDGGTLGLYLVQYIEGAKKVLIFDAIDFGYDPGTVLTIRDEDVPKFSGAKKMSLHQTGLQDILQIAALNNRMPKHITIIGIQPISTEDFSNKLTNTAIEKLNTVVDLGVEELSKWGFSPTKRTKKADKIELMNPFI